MTNIINLHNCSRPSSFPFTNARTQGHNHGYTNRSRYPARGIRWGTSRGTVRWVDITCNGTNSVVSPALAGPPPPQGFEEVLQSHYTQEHELQYEDEDGEEQHFLILDGDSGVAESQDEGYADSNYGTYGEDSDYDDDEIPHAEHVEYAEQLQYTGPGVFNGDDYDDDEDDIPTTERLEDIVSRLFPD